MELNSLELIRRIEEEFSIYLPEDELREVYTVGNLYNLLLRLLKPTPDCLTSKAFYRVRRALMSVLVVPRSSVRPSTFLDDLFDQKRIRQQWRAVTVHAGCNCRVFATRPCGNTGCKRYPWFFRSRFV